MSDYDELTKPLRPGDIVKVLNPGGGEVFLQVTNTDKLVYEDVASAVAANTTEGSYTAVNNLNPPYDQLYHITRLEIDGNVRVRLRQPAAMQRFGVERSPDQVLQDRDAPIGMGFPIVFWITENNQPARLLINNTETSITPTFWWHGWKYSVMRLPGPVTGPFRTIAVTGLPK